MCSEENGVVRFKPHELTILKDDVILAFDRNGYRTAVAHREGTSETHHLTLGSAAVGQLLATSLSSLNLAVLALDVVAALSPGHRRHHIKQNPRPPPHFLNPNPLIIPVLCV